MVASTASPEFVPVLDVDGPREQSRVTVLFRFLLLIPHVIALLVLGIAATVVVVVGWFAALVTGRLPAWAAEFLSGYVAWSVRVSAYSYLLVDEYPPFALKASGYPVAIEVQPGELNRLAVLFRLVLAIPAAIVTAVVTSGWGVAAFVIWIVVLVQGRMPTALFETSNAVLRYSYRYQVYAYLLTPTYPRALFGDADGERSSPTRPLVLSQNARTLLVVFLVLGVVSLVVQTVNNAS